MRGLEATLPPAFSLLKSEFNDFLFAPIGEEGNHAVLTVLSALARLDIDPWQESALLAQQSKDAATQRLTSIIASLPNGLWAPSDAGTIAARLIALLPTKRAVALPARGPAATRSQLARPASSSDVRAVNASLRVRVLVMQQPALWVAERSTGRQSCRHPTAPRVRLAGWR